MTKLTKQLAVSQSQLRLENQKNTKLKTNNSYIQQLLRDDSSTFQLLSELLFSGLKLFILCNKGLCQLSDLGIFLEVPDENKKRVIRRVEKSRIETK